MYCYHCMFKRRDDSALFCSECGNEYNGHIAQSNELPPGTVIGNGRYLVGVCIGAGGFALTYVGLDLNIDKKILIKETFYNGTFQRNCYNTRKSNYLSVTYKNDISLEKIMNKARKECESLSRAEDLDNVVKVYDYFNENNTSYIITEFINGITLAKKVENYGRYSWKELYPKLKPLMISLTELHKMGILHRDIKPENIMIKNTRSSGERFVLIDFGLSHSLSAHTQATLSVAFTPGYAPFEQRNLSGKDGTFIDVYSLAATIYFALTGETPSPGMGDSEDEIFPELRFLNSKYGVPENVENALCAALNLNYGLPDKSKLRLENNEK